MPIYLMKPSRISTICCPGAASADNAGVVASDHAPAKSPGHGKISVSNPWWLPSLKLTAKRPLKIRFSKRKGSSSSPIVFQGLCLISGVFSGLSNTMISKLVVINPILQKIIRENCHVWWQIFLRILELWNHMLVSMPPYLIVLDAISDPFQQSG